MMNIRHAILIAWLSLAASVSAAPPTDQLAALQAQLPGKLINDPSRLDWDVNGAGASSKAIKGSDAPGGGAIQVTIPAKGATAYAVGINVPLTGGFTKGATYVVSFYARTIKASTADGNGVIGVRFQQNAAPYGGFGDTTKTLTQDWQLYEVTAQANLNVPKDQAVIGFQLSGAKQIIEIGQTIVQEGATSILKPTEAKIAACEVTTPVLPLTLVNRGPVLTNIDTQNWDVYGTGETHKRVQACGVPGDSAIEFNIAAKGANLYDVGTSLPLNDAIKEGDILVIGVVARTIKADTADGMGLITLRVQQDGAGYPGFGDHTIPFGPAWQLKRFTVKADRDIMKGHGLLAIQLAGAKQVIQVGRAYVIHAPHP
jgi:hypothetical protein